MKEQKTALNNEHLDQVSGGTILPYVVKAGDSLKDIAARYHVTPELLAKWNNIENPDILKAGQLLKIKF